MVAKESLVTQPSRVECGATKGTFTLRETAFATQVEHIPSESADALVSHLKNIAKSVISAGFSKDVAERVARGKICQSSLRVYDF